MRRVPVLLAIVLAVVALDCGDNTETVSPAGSVSPPQNLKAFSLNKQAVRLQWTAPPEANDSSFKGYLIQWGGKQDSLQKSVLSYTVDSLASGEATFTLYSRTKSGTVSTGASIHWAPADRLPGTYTLLEFIQPSSVTNTAIDVGTGGGSAQVVSANDASPSFVDFYLFGGNVGGDTLKFEAADVRLGGTYKPSRFSSVMHSSTTLDYYLSAFPDQGSFTLQSIAVAPNTIYYAYFLNPSQTKRYYARILVISVSLSAPRSVVMQISLQRAADTPFADAAPPGEFGPARALVLPCMF
jgi:hypothetical protein